MLESKYITPAEEKILLQEWFDTVAFDHPSEGIPELEPERDDEGRSVNYIDAADIVDWFHSPAGTAIPLSSRGTHYVYENEQAWQLITDEQLGMKKEAARFYIEKETRFLELYGDNNRPF